MSPSAERRQLALQLRANARRIERASPDVLCMAEIRQREVSSSLIRIAQYLEDVDGLHSRMVFGEAA
jgi:hypothetical protein